MLTTKRSFRIDLVSVTVFQFTVGERTEKQGSNNNVLLYTLVKALANSYSILISKSCKWRGYRHTSQYLLNSYYRQRGNCSSILEVVVSLE